jgi:hypothetical protein
MNIEERTTNRYELSLLVRGILKRLGNLEDNVSSGSQSSSDTSWQRRIISFNNNPILLNISLMPQTEYVLQDELVSGKTLNVDIASNSSINNKMLVYRVVVTTGSTVGTLSFNFNGSSSNILWKGNQVPNLETNTIHRFRIVQYPTHLFLELE